MTTKRIPQQIRISGARADKKYSGKGKKGKYLASTDLLSLEDFVVVPRWRPDEDPDGYQRSLDEHRVADVAQSLRGTGTIDGSIILVAAPGVSVKYSSKGKMLVIDTNGQGTLEVLDGQHRLFGAFRFGNETKRGVPKVQAQITVYVGLSRGEAAALFCEIHDKAKRVAAGSLEEARRVAGLGSSVQVQSNAFYDAASVEGGPLHGLVFDGKQKRGRVNRRQVKDATKHVFSPTGPLENVSPTNRQKIVLLYFKSVHKQLAEKKDLGRSTLLAALCDVLPAVITRIAATGSKISGRSMDAALVALKGFKLAELDKKTRSAITNALKRRLLPIQLDDGML